MSNGFYSISKYLRGQRRGHPYQIDLTCLYARILVSAVTRGAFRCRARATIIRSAESLWNSPGSRVDSTPSCASTATKFTLSMLEAVSNQSSRGMASVNRFALTSMAISHAEMADTKIAPSSDDYSFSIASFALPDRSQSPLTHQSSVWVSTTIKPAPPNYLRQQAQGGL